MKNLCALFFSKPVKIILTLLILTLSVFIGETQLDYFTYYMEDQESFVNALSQIDLFDYEKSRYFRNSVKNTVENVILLSMEYEDIFSEGASVEKYLAYCSSIGDTTFPKAYDQLKKSKGLRFALVNLDTRKIYSNIADLNGRDSSADVRKYFRDYGKTLLIARSCQNPYFATDRYIDYASHIRDCAQKYEDNFDLYIAFGTDDDFNENEAHYRSLHFGMRTKIERLNNTLAVLAVFTLLLTALLLTVTGKHEPGGKTYPSMMSRLPNDLLVSIYSIVIFCILSLYRSAATMLTTHGNELDEFWFTHSQSFYEGRLSICVVIFIYALINIICILKRQYKRGTLIRNTYLYEYIKVRKMNREEAKEPESDN